MKTFLAFDLGASSGRAILGHVGNGKVDLQEIHRFSNGPTEVNGHLYWNLLGLFAELKTGLRKACETGVEIAGMAIDTWGVDFAMLDCQGSFLGFASHYRDARTANIEDYAFAKVPRQQLYQSTGIQHMQLNTIFQLAAMQRDELPALKLMQTLLLMPNALTYLFSGYIGAEYTIASTTELLDPNTRQWAWDIIDQFGFERSWFPAITPPGTIVGKVKSSICAELNCPPVPVILVGSHDTASAVAAVPAQPGTNWAYLSSGTWSLLGLELDQPMLSTAARQADFTNEGGVGGKIRFLKNIMGMWLIQESRNTWTRQGQQLTFDDLDGMAAAAEPFRSLVDPNDARFVTPGDMPARIQSFCRDTGQPVPETPGQIMRCALESLALKYRQTVDELQQISASPIDMLHLVGGGTRNLVLNQYTANALNRPVITGPTEATAMGNIICQAMAVGEISSLEAARDLVRNSSESKTFLPQDAAAWQAAYQRFITIG